MSEAQDPRLKKFKTEFARQAASLAITSLEVAKENERLVAQLAEAKAVLALVQFTNGRQAIGPDTYTCPMCEMEQRLGHAPDCRLAKVLGDV